MELLKRERFWKDQENPSLNIINPYITDEERKKQKKKWNEEHVDDIKEQKKKWYEAHEVEVKNRAKKCYEAHIREVKQRMKRYIEQHPNKIKEQRKKYREQHREQINQKTTCPYCNIILMKRYLKTHINKSCQINLFRSRYMF